MYAGSVSFSSSSSSPSPSSSSPSFSSSDSSSSSPSSAHFNAPDFKRRQLLFDSFSKLLERPSPSSSASGDAAGGVSGSSSSALSHTSLYATGSPASPSKGSSSSSSLPSSSSLSSSSSSSSPSSSSLDSSRGTLLYTWGAGYHSQLGLNTARKKCRALPTCLSSFCEPIRQVAAGGFHSAVLTDSGKVMTWGDGRAGQLGNLVRKHNIQPSPAPVDYFINYKISISFIACGQQHTACISTAGSLYTFGAGKTGALGHGTRLDERFPRRVEGLKGLVRVACGDKHTVTLTEEGQVATFGSGEHGQLGHGGSGDALRPQALSPSITPLASLRVSFIAAGATTTAAIAAPDGDVWLWGFGESIHPKEMNNVVDVPRRVDTGLREGIKQVAVGQGHVLLLSVAGDVYAFGSSSFSQIGHGSTSHVRFPRLVLRGKEVQQIAAGRYHSAAVTAYGVVYSWGNSESGDCGHGGLSNEPFPRIIASLLPTVVGAVACGQHHNLALTSIEHAGVALDVHHWHLIEEEERRLKEGMAAMVPNGLKSKHVMQVEQERKNIIAQLAEQLKREREEKARAAQEKMEMIQSRQTLAPGAVEEAKKRIGGAGEKAVVPAAKEGAPAASAPSPPDSPSSSASRRRPSSSSPSASSPSSASLRAKSYSSRLSIHEEIDAERQQNEEEEKEHAAAVAAIEAVIRQTMGKELRGKGGKRRGAGGEGEETEEESEEEGEEEESLTQQYLESAMPPGSPPSPSFPTSARTLAASATEPSLLRSSSSSSDEKEGPSSLSSSPSQPVFHRLPFSVSPSTSSPPSAFSSPHSSARAAYHSYLQQRERGERPSSALSDASTNEGEPGRGRSPASSPSFSTVGGRKLHSSHSSTALILAGLSGKKKKGGAVTPFSPSLSSSASSPSFVPPASSSPPPHLYNPLAPRISFIEAQTRSLSKVKSFIAENPVAGPPEFTGALLRMKNNYNSLKNERERMEREISKLRNTLAFAKPNHVEEQKAHQFAERLKELNMKLVTLNTRLSESDENKKNYELTIIRMKEEDLQLSKQIDGLRAVNAEYDRYVARVERQVDKLQHQKSAVADENSKFLDEINEFVRFSDRTVQQYRSVLNQSLRQVEYEQQLGRIREEHLEEKKALVVNKLQAELGEVMGEGSALRASHQQWEDKVEFYEKKYRKISAATGLNKADQIIAKFYSNDGITKELKKEIEEKKEIIRELTGKEEELQALLNEYKENRVMSKWKDVSELEEKQTEKSIILNKNKEEAERWIQRVAITVEGINSIKKNINKLLRENGKEVPTEENEEKAAPSTEGDKDLLEESTGWSQQSVAVSQHSLQSHVSALLVALEKGAAALAQRRLRCKQLETQRRDYEQNLQRTKELAMLLQKRSVWDAIGNPKKEDGNKGAGAANSTGTANREEKEGTLVSH